jgi:hypothetical protein
MTETPLSIPSLVDEVLDAVHGYSRHQEQRTSLTSSIDSDDLSFAVDDISQISRGMVEVEDELMQVATVDAANNAVTIEPWSGTTASSHAAGVRVTGAPLFPRQRVRNAIYGVLREVFPQVYAVTSTTLTGSATVTNYELPSDAYHVIKVENHLFGASGMWIPVKRWRQNKTATTVEVEIISPVAMGADRLRVQYVRVPPTSFTATDDLTTFGYDYQVRDLIILGSSAKLMAFSETSRAQTESMVGHGRAEGVPAGAATNVSKQLYALYQKRVDDERQQLQLRYPLQHHFTR